jgi:hypothetical protein
MPMKDNRDFGSNANGERNDEYCHFCYQNGVFTDPELTLDKQIEKLVSIATGKMGMSVDLARETAKTVLPTLKRWKR